MREEWGARAPWTAAPGERLNGGSAVSQPRVYRFVYGMVMATLLVLTVLVGFALAAWLVSPYFLLGYVPVALILSGSISGR